MTVKDAIGSQAFFVFQFVGYSMFLGAGWFILLALCRASADVRQYRRYMRQRKAPACRLLTVVRNSERGQENVLSFPAVLGAKSARKAASRG
jgi:hypothetical protein